MVEDRDPPAARAADDRAVRVRHRSRRPRASAARARSPSARSAPSSRSRSSASSSSSPRWPPAGSHRSRRSAEAASWLLALAVPLLAVAFLVGVWRWRLFIAEAMQRLAVRLQGRSGRRSSRRALAEEFDDPIARDRAPVDDDPGHWVDVAGDEVPAPEATAEHRADRGLRRRRACRGDPSRSGAQRRRGVQRDGDVLRADDARRASGSRRRPTGSLSEVREARARARSPRPRTERRRIEHDLHDGAQQRLIALGIRLELAAERTAALDPAAAKLLRGLGAEVDQALRRGPRARTRRSARRAGRARPRRRTAHGAGAARALPVTVLDIAASGATRRRSRPRRSSAVSRRCRTRPSTHATRPSWSSSSPTTTHALRLEVRDDGDGFDERAVTRGDRAGEHARADRGRRRRRSRSVPGRAAARACGARIPIA